MFPLAIIFDHGDKKLAGLPNPSTVDPEGLGAGSEIGQPVIPAEEPEVKGWRRIFFPSDEERLEDFYAEREAINRLGSNVSRTASAVVAPITETAGTVFTAVKWAPYVALAIAALWAYDKVK